MIEVKNLVKVYGEHLAVDHISFTLEPGLIYGFLGPNGAGKSTTMNMMTGYLGATGGQVIINGHSILEEPEEAKRCIGYLPEHPPVYMDMTVREYLNFCAELKGIEKKEIPGQVAKVVKRARLEEVFDRLISNLSKGYRQRVGIAQAILGFPEIIILDEPTVGLDPKQIIEIRQLIRSLGKNHTVIRSTHILSEAQEVCDRIIIIHQGRLMANGTAAELEEKLGKTSLDFTIRTDSPDELTPTFSEMDGVLGVKVTSEAPGEVTWSLRTRRGLDIREDIYNFCVERRLPLLMMHNTEYSLEQIFLEITGQNVSDRKLKRRKKVKAEEGEASPAEPAAEPAPAPAETEKGGPAE